MHPPGWYLGLRYMQGTGLIARAAEKIEPARRNADFIFADRVLCAAKNWRDILDDWFDALAPNGCLILWLPDCRHSDLAPGEAKFTLPDIEGAFDRRPAWQMHEADLIGGFIYAVWQKRSDRKQIKSPWRKRDKHLLIARTGAHGDALMAASILPWLKEQGWAISFISKPAGFEVLKHDPHIDELILLVPGQLKSEKELPYYWQAWEKRFDRFINLTHSVEGELLKHPDRGDYWWPHDQRRLLCGQSYLAHTHELAGVPKPYRVRFYPNLDEKIWTGIRKLAYGRFVLWCLRGSAVHKWWPYGPEAICRILARTKLNIVLAGNAEADPLAQDILEAVKKYHGDAHRVHNLCGANSIREIMALAHHASVVAGPETGVMNAVSLETVPKVLLLSHSSASNLPDDWRATTALKPSAPCYPCHRLHYGHDWCPQDEATGAASCAASITVEQVVNAVLKAAKLKRKDPWWEREQKLAA